MIFRKLSHIILSILLITLSTGFTIDYHYCQGELVSVSIDKPAKSCCENPSCCNNKTVYVQLENDFLQSSFTAETPVSPVLFDIPVFWIFSAVETEFACHSFRKPNVSLPFKKDLTVLFQSFLI